MSITKSEKIRILINENKKLRAENKHLQELSNETLSKKMISEIKRYTDITDKLYKKYAELDKLRFPKINHLKYHWMLFKIKLRSKLGL